MSIKIRLLILAVLCLFPAIAEAQTIHSATLTWVQSTSPGITGNNVYRSLVSGGPYTLITISPLAPVTTYVDLAVISATMYCYVTTALVGSEESAYSPQACATVPTTTIAPTGLTAVAK
jgi:hypothetical protein